MMGRTLRKEKGGGYFGSPFRENWRAFSIKVLRKGRQNHIAEGEPKNVGKVPLPNQKKVIRKVQVEE